MFAYVKVKGKVFSQATVYTITKEINRFKTGRKYF